MSNPQFYIGIMSGTSADGIDLALMDFSRTPATLVAQHFQPYSEQLKANIKNLYFSGENEIDQAGALGKALAHAYAEAIDVFLNKQELASDDISAIGNHGQTVRHRPNVSEDISNPFTMQIGCNQLLACLTNIRVIGDFRTKDMALGGQGAPLAPRFHQERFGQADEDVFVVNIGGIANVTYLPANTSKPVIGFDTGPGNALMDDWYAEYHSGDFDESGKWAATGQINSELLSALLEYSYFAKAAPKSTGREEFTLAWLKQKLSSFEASPASVQATLAALTASSITDAINALATQGKVYICGGGVFNKNLINQLTSLLPSFQVQLTDELGLPADSLESCAFAWFAYAFDNKIFGNIPAVTGAYKSTILGVEFNP